MDSKGNRQVCTNQTCSISITATVDAGSAQWTAEGKQISLTRFSFAIILVLYSRVLLLQILHLGSLHLGKLQGPANWKCRVWVPLWKKLLLMVVPLLVTKYGTRWTVGLTQKGIFIVEKILRISKVQSYPCHCSLLFPHNVFTDRKLWEYCCVGCSLTGMFIIVTWTLR